MPRPRNSPERRAQIVDGLLELMASKGYERASVARIARAAGLSPGLVHYHFSSKQEILLELARRMRERFEQRFEARMERAGDDPRERLWAFLDAHLALDATTAPRDVAAWVVVGAEAVRQPEVAELFRASCADRHARLRSLIADCLRAEGKSARGATQLAAAMLALIEGSFQLGASASGLLPRGYAGPSARRLLEAVLDA